MFANSKNTKLRHFLLKCSWIWLAVTIGLSWPAAADDACSTKALYAYADVTASDGKKYSVESFYRSKDRVATKFIRADGGSLHVVEGPFTWVLGGEKAELAIDSQRDFQRDFALGHQFHALLIHFRDIMTDIEPAQNIEFASEKVSALKGTRSTGGAVYLIDGKTPDQPAGLRFDVADLKIDIIASDWRVVDGKQIPFALLIDDGTRTFDYQYKIVDIADRPLSWFYENVPSPDLDEIGVLRLHRQILVAHCLGEAAMMAQLTAPAATVVSGGGVFDINPQSMETTFTGTFGRRKYATYTDLQHPRIEVSAAGDIGWASVQVNTTGKLAPSGDSFDETWGWVMMAKKIEGRWLMAGNASNINP